MPAPEPRMLDEAFRVPLSRHRLERFVHRHRGLFERLGTIESRLLADRLRRIPIDRPIFISGLARAGSTLLLEVLAAHPDVATHQYRDFPFLWTPYGWHAVLSRTPGRDPKPRERAHGDGMMVTPASPEAMEEPMWMHFFPKAHAPQHSHWLDRHTAHPRFERFYRDHLKKMLLIRGGGRYVAKCNYHLTRFAYLHSLLPDSRFVLPVRKPADHIASLMKQHRLFCQGQRRHPRALAHMARVGHFEFGLNRTPINAGDHAVNQQIRNLWQRGEEVRGWARYWAHLHQRVADQIDSDPALRAATRVVRHEDLCDQPEHELTKLLEHGELAPARTVIQRFARQIQRPGYYRSQFTAGEQAVIDEETQHVARRFGYGQ